MFAARHLNRSLRRFAPMLVTLLLVACFDDGSSSGHSSTTAVVPVVPPPTTASTAPPPVPLSLQGTPPATTIAGNAFWFRPTVSKSSSPITFAVTGLPHWAKFSATTGALSGTPAVKDEGTTGHIGIAASNGSSTASLTPFTIRISAPSGGTGTASISWIAPTENTDGTPVTDLAGYHLYYGTNASELTETITVQGAASINYVFSDLDPGTYYFAIVAYNSAGTDSGKSNVVNGEI
jgi:Putative Ig domain